MIVLLSILVTILEMVSLMMIKTVKDFKIKIRSKDDCLKKEIVMKLKNDKVVKIKPYSWL